MLYYLPRLRGAAVCAIALAALTVSDLSAQTFTPTTVANSISVRGSDATAGIDFFGTTGSNALVDNGDGTLSAVTGSSGRAIHGLFAAQTLTNIGESLSLTFDFLTPAGINTDGATNNDFRFGLFDTSGATPGFSFAQDIGSLPNTELNALAGFHGEIDDVNGGGGGDDLGLRTHNINSTADAAAPTGSLLNSNTGFDFISGGADNLVTLTPNTTFQGSLLVELNQAGFLDLTVGINDAAGNVIDSHTDTVSINDIAGTEVGVNTSTFDLFAVQSGGGTFGDNTDLDDPNNGIDITGIEIVFNGLDVVVDPGPGPAVPEPSSAVLLALSGLAVCFRRRRN